MAIHFEESNASDVWLNSAPRAVPGWLVLLISGLTFGTALYHISGGMFGVAEAFRHRTTHVVLFLLLTFLVFPLGRHSWREPLRWLSLVDLALILVTLGCYTYMIRDIDGLAMRSGLPNTADVINGTLLIAVVLEAIRRTVGFALVIIPLFFMVHAIYAPHYPGIFYAAPTDYNSLISYLTMDTDGMLGIPISVASTFIIAFMLFGAVLVRSGAGKFFTNVAYSATGWMSGGPAKAAALASGLYGTLSGSTTANVVTSGSFTIPLMKSSGFNARTAASIEAIASNGGQIMPPIMGAAAFIIPMYIPGISYGDVALAAIIPAILYFFALFMMIHLNARKSGLVGIPKSELPKVGPELRRGWPLLLSLLAIIILLMMGFTPMVAGVAALIVTLIVVQFRPETRLKPADVIAALENGVRATIPIVIACAAAGLIIGSMDLSGLASRFSRLILEVAQGNLLPGLLMTMLICIVLGMGMTTTIIYITLAALVVPSLIDMGVTAMGANLFVFYFGALSGVTPPIALTTYAAAGIAGSNPWQTGWTAAKMGLVSFIIPFMFVYTPALLLDGSIVSIILATLTALAGVMAFTAAIQGYIEAPLKWWERLAFAIAALLLVSPDIWLGTGALIGAAAVLSLHLRRARSSQSAEVAP
ncbi:TRAP transporter permease [Roseovarius sp. ZX-A-9]|uniref:TRAP transporter permease n=1 Tax=Roseovarius sp. ZX-A-9 TaxID=3014783 RepID=UPI00232AE0AB|nr:TRAP transporter permease [Roseovarius sp. ZX-A-9]